MLISMVEFDTAYGSQVILSEHSAHGVGEDKIVDNLDNPSDYLLGSLIPTREEWEFKTEAGTYVQVSKETFMADMDLELGCSQFKSLGNRELSYEFYPA